MINMVILVKDCAQAQQGKKGGKTKLFFYHHSFSDKISLYNLCMKYGYHREVIHTIFKNWVIDANITTSALGNMFASFRHVSSIQSKDDASFTQDTESEDEDDTPNSQHGYS